MAEGLKKKMNDCGGKRRERTKREEKDRRGKGEGKEGREGEVE